LITLKIHRKDNKHLTLTFSGKFVPDRDGQGHERIISHIPYWLYC